MNTQKLEHFSNPKLPFPPPSSKFLLSLPAFITSFGQINHLCDSAVFPPILSPFCAISPSFFSPPSLHRQKNQMKIFPSPDFLKIMKIPFSIIVIALISIMGCKPAELAYTSDMNHEAMVVKGRQGKQIGQIIRYGEFTTDKVRRGWTKAYDLPFILRFQGAKEKISFTQFSPGGQEAAVACVSKFNAIELPLIKDYFSVPLNHKNFFAGTIVFNGGTAYWDFILYNPDGDFLRKQVTTGFIRSGSKLISIQPIRGLDGQPQWARSMTVNGHEFWIDDQVVGAVSLVNNGKVWMDPSLKDEQKSVIAAVATGLLLRTDVETHTDDLFQGQDFPFQL